MSSWSLRLDQHNATNLWLLLGESLSTRLSVLLGQFHWDAFHAHVFCQNGLYWSKWKPQFIRELSNCYFLVIHHGRMHFVSHHFVSACGGLPERSSLSTDIHPSLNCLNHSLTCIQPIVSFPKAFWIISLTCIQPIVSFPKAFWIIS